MKKAILLGILVLVSVGMTFVASASGVSQHILRSRQSIVIDAEKAENLRALEPAEDWKIRAFEIVMEDPRIQEILEAADYHHLNVSAVYELREYESKGGEGTPLPLRKGLPGWR